MAGRGHDAIDALVGRNIRILRLDHGLSQTELAQQLGVTFQQVQKYEKGTNRVGSGRLFRIARIFGVPVSALFAGTELPDGDGESQSPTALLSEPHALRLVRAFSTVESTDLRRTIADLVEIISLQFCQTAHRHGGKARVPRARPQSAMPDTTN